MKNAKQLPDAETFNIIILPSDFSIVTYFKLDNDIEHNEKVGVIVYNTLRFILPTYLTDYNISIRVDEIKNTINEIKIDMKDDELIAILKGTHKNINKPELRSVHDIFERNRNQLIKDFRQSQISEEIRTEEIKRLTYESVFSWIKENAKKNKSYGGVFISKAKSGIFDKTKYKLYVCFSKDGDPQTDTNDPKIIFGYSELDDSLSDMFNSNDTLHLNFK